MKCILCGEEIIGYGNNPYPLSETGRCCDACDMKVIFERIKILSDKRRTNINDK